MIGRLHGVLLQHQFPQLLIDVNGVGYEVDAPMSTCDILPPVGQAVTLHIHMVVREDAQLLYGFGNERERILFRTLLKVNGVGAKMALAILSGMSCDEFADAIHNEDTTSLVRLPGIGTKTAQRLIIEMRDRLADWKSVTTASAETSSTASGKSTITNHNSSEAESALMALGYKPAEATRLIATAAKISSDTSSEGLIRAALKLAVSGNK